MEVNNIYNMDCLDGMKMMESESVDLIITSPPYNIGEMKSNTQKHGTYAGNNMNEHDYQQWQIDVLSECFRVLKKDGSLFYNHKVRIRKGKAIHPLEWVFKTDFTLKQEITWDQGKSANSDKIRFFPYSERIYWLTKNANVVVDNELRLSDVWRVVPTHTRHNVGHIAVMPDQIVENILGSVEGNIVLDPFVGSGTTLAVARRKGRSYIGFEIDVKYYNLAKNNIEKVTEQTDIFQFI